MNPVLIYGFALAGPAIVNSVSNFVNGKKNRKQQEKLAHENQIFNERMEANRQNFQLKLNRENAENQRELSEQNHRQRLLEQENNFKLLIQGKEWDHFLKDWPLQNLPSVLRKDQILDDGTVALRVFYSKSTNQIFSAYVYPLVERGLLEFTDLYHNVFSSKNIIFYHRGYKEGVYGGAYNANIKHALNDVPIVIIDTDILLDEICVSATIWGFDNVDGQHMTLFKLPFRIKSVNGKPDNDSVKQLANEILAHLKFVLGCAYDTYNMVMYDRAPLLPQIANYEFTQGLESAFLRYGNIKAFFGKQYGEIYSILLSGDGSDENKSFAELPESNKTTILHNLRLDYALAAKDVITPEVFSKCLVESINAWCALRTTIPSADFLNSLAGDKEKILQYFAFEDVDYFKKLCAAYETSVIKNKACEACLRIKGDVLNAEPEIASTNDKAVVVTKKKNNRSKATFIEF